MAAGTFVLQKWTVLYAWLGDHCLLLEPLVAEDRHNAGDDLALDAGLSAVPNPLVEDLVVVEDLSDHKVSSSIHLLLKVADVVFSTRGSQMHLGVACDHNAEVVSIFLSNEPHEVACIAEPILYCHPVSNPSGRVSSQRKQIANTQGFRLQIWDQ